LWVASTFTLLAAALEETPTPEGLLAPLKLNWFLESYLAFKFMVVDFGLNRPPLPFDFWVIMADCRI